MERHGNRTRMAVQSPTEQKAEELARQLDNMFRPRLRKSLTDMKRSLRDPYPAPAQSFSDILADRLHPMHSMGLVFARMMVGGADQFTMRCMAATVFDWLDQFYANELPSFRELAPRLAVEVGEMDAANMVAMVDPSKCQLERAEEQTRDVHVLADIARKRLAQDIRTAGSRPSLTLAGR